MSVKGLRSGTREKNAQKIKGQSDGQQNDDEGDVGLAGGDCEEIDIDGPSDKVDTPF